MRRIYADKQDHNPRISVESASSAFQSLSYEIKPASATMEPMSPTEVDPVQLRAAMSALEGQRTILGDGVVDAALGSMRAQLAALEVGRSFEDTRQQRKQATVLFADVVGFTALSETMDAEEVTELINALWMRIDRVVTDHGGHIDKHIGDAVMAIWGADESREDDPEQAVHAALGMQAEVDAFSVSVSREGRLPPDVALKLRVGINTGPVLLGQVGLTREYTAMGDTVNLTHRLEQIAPLGGILVAHNTYRHIRGIFDAQPLGPISIRGRHEQVPAYVILRSKPRAFRMTTRGVEGIETRMVGRDAELAALQTAFEEIVVNGETRVVTLIGDAGVGKSRMLFEFENWVELRPERVRHFKGRATPGLQSVPYSLWRDLLAFRFDILDSDSPTVALSKFRKGMGVGDESAAPIPYITDIVGHWLGFDFSSSPAVARLSGSPDFAALAQSHFLRFARALATERGVAVLLEDIHWADDSSLDLIYRMAEAVPDAHLLIICLTRPSLFDRRPEWGERMPGYRPVWLSPLDEPASRALVGEILKRADRVPEPLSNLVVAAAEGNPFYIEELVKMLIEQGVIVRGREESDETSDETAERWRIVEEKLGVVPVPDTLTALLQARVDGLPARERAILQRAAVVGRIFWDDAVAALLDGDSPTTPDMRGDGPADGPGDEPARAGLPEAALRSILESLARRELITLRPRPAFAGTVEYTFRHNLLREVVYETVLLRHRKSYHAKVARWLEVNSGARLAEYLGLIAQHYIQAGLDGRAAAYLERAGDAAQRSGAYHSARTAFEQALALRPADNGANGSGDALSGLRLKLGAVCWNLGDFPAAERSLFMARDHARRSGDTRTQATALYWLSRVAISRGDYAQARMLLAYGLPLARAADPDTLAQTLYGVADVAWKLGDLETLQTYITESLSLARAVGNTTLELLALNRLGTMAYLRGELDTARSYYQTCLDLARSTGNLEREATALMNLGALDHRQGDPAGGMTHYRSALAHYRELGRSEQVVMALGNLAEAGVERGDCPVARRDLREGMALAWRLGLLPRATVMLFVYGRYLDAMSERAKAAAVLRLVLAHPATESQTRPQIESLLRQWGEASDGPAAELHEVVAEILRGDE